MKEGETPDYLQGALVAFDPANGYVRALVGGRDFNESRFNRGIQAKRQSGSAFKPFVFAAALEAGYTPATLITRLNDPVLASEGQWLPEDEHSTADSMTLRSALRTSSNRAAVQLLNTVGIPRAVSYAEKLNVGTPPSVPSLALGASDVTLTALTAAYGAFSNGGIVRKPVLIRRVEDSDGNVLYTEPGKADRAVSESTAFLMASMLADVINAGTAYPARRIGFTLPAAGKTGTTNDYHDAWFVGYTPHLVTGVWVGYDQPRTIMRNGYAADLAVPMWARFMKVATRGDEPDWFTPPPGVTSATICRISGKLATDGCRSVESVDEFGNLTLKSMVYTEFFVHGTVPEEYCPLHNGYGSGSLVTLATSGSPADAPRAAAAPEPVPPTSVASSPAAAPHSAVVDKPADQPQAKKRGFWGRLFGRDGDNGNKKQK